MILRNLLPLKAELCMPVYEEYLLEMFGLKDGRKVGPVSLQGHRKPCICFGFVFSKFIRSRQQISDEMTIKQAKRSP